MKVKIAFITDIDKIVEVADATWRQAYASIISQEHSDYMYERTYSTEAILQQMQDGVTFLMCFEDDKILGFVSYQIQEDFNPKGNEMVIYIPKLYVKPEAHKKGIGKLLIDAVEKIAIKNKIEVLELNVNRKNPAMYFYKKIGFELHEKVDTAYGKFWLNDYVLRKKIEPK